MRVVLTRPPGAGLVPSPSLLTAASCERLMGTKIAKIAADPGSYEGQDVTVTGTVTERIDVPSVRCYVLSDGKASIGVVTKGNLPVAGAKAEARGRVSSPLRSAPGDSSSSSSHPSRAHAAEEPGRARKGPG